MHPERALPKGKTHDTHNLPCDFRGVGIGGLEAGKSF